MWCEELTRWKRLWCWERLKAGEGDDRGWDGWMASPTEWTWIWVNFGSWWWTGRPGVLQSMGWQRAGHDWAELNCTEGFNLGFSFLFFNSCLINFLSTISLIFSLFISSADSIIKASLYICLDLFLASLS